jgi:dipeptidyl aminopeptidase/acylaminoacyl peptidase
MRPSGRLIRSFGHKVDAMFPHDLALVRAPGAPTLSPDGRWAVVAVGRPDLDNDDYRSQLWRVDLEGVEPARQLTFGERDTEPAWSPDGRYIAFLRGAADTPSQLHLMAADGGEARALHEHRLGTERPVWAPDSARIAYAAKVPEDGRYEQGKDAKPAGKEAPRRITTMRYRHDGVGFQRDRPVHVFVLDPHTQDAEPLQITSEDLGHRTPAWSPDGTELLLAPWHEDRQDTLANEVYAVPAPGGEPRRLTDSQFIASDVRLHDGTLYVLGLDELDEAGRTPGIFALPEGGVPQRLTDRESCELVESAAGPLFEATAQGLLALSARHGSVQLVRVPYDGSEPELLSPQHRQVKGFAVAGDVIAATIGAADSMGEVFVLRDGEWVQRSDFGRPLSEGTTLLPMQELTATSSDGYPVHGWLVRPEGEGPHPVLLVIHGGPFTQYGYQLFDEAQVYAAAGYAVVLGNPRGSSGYGEAHGRAIIGDMGNSDRADLMALLDHALDEPRLDPTRVGVMGGSYGGYMSAWLSAHEGSTRFKAAIVERALTAWDSFEGTSDIGWIFGDIYVGTEPDKLRDQSPLTHADKIDLPVLIIHSENDYRCPLEQAQRLFVRLRRNGVEAEMLLFPGEGHELSRSGLPSHRVARFDAILDWWARHL